MNPKPFIKWAGGKSQLLSDIRRRYPFEMGVSITKYCEPFIGGGAVFFDIVANFNMQEILINDINVELINTYTQIKEHIDELIPKLQMLQDVFGSMNSDERKRMYYEKRDYFNFIKTKGSEADNVEKAAIFIFLNKTCFNGLYRVNKKGLFNVPMGSYKHPIICDEGNLKNISKLLEKVTIKCGDYKDCLTFIDINTFVYIDPPYRPLTETAKFTAYCEMQFNDNQQILLGQFVDKVNDIGAKVVISNSDPKNSDEQDDFFDVLYKSYCIERISANRRINCNGGGRGTVSELLISNY